MGKAIDAIAQVNDPDKHRDFSRELSKFATDAEGIVREHHGVLIYSGGDDVLAFVPVDWVLKCARRLYEAFERTMQEALKGIEVKRPTLSVGVAIGHFLENLEDLLAYGRAAEKAAKQPNRDGLAVHLHKRGGVPVKVRKQWVHRLDLSVEQYASWFLDGAISGRTPYELHRLADVYEEWKDEATLAEAIRCDAIRVIDKKRPGGPTSQMEAIRNEMKRVSKPEDLREFARELLIARQLASVLRQGGSPWEVKP
jgi:CRISPR-associated protein Cmr2